MKKQTSAEEIKMITSMFDEASKSVIASLESFSKQHISKESKAAIEKERIVLQKLFINDLKRSVTIAQQAAKGKNTDAHRLQYANKAMQQSLKNLREVFPKTANIWVLEGILVAAQRAGLKYVYNGKDTLPVIDYLNSASSVSLGFQNPWIAMMDRVDDHIGMRDNVCTAYHPGMKQAFGLEELRKLHPGFKRGQKLVVHSESSGTIVDSIAIESVVAHFEKTHNKPGKVLAVDGTWSGGYGTAREATGFGVDKIQTAKTKGETVWVDRILPAPTKENTEQFLGILDKGIRNGTVAGIYLEPDIIGDLGIVMTDRNLLLQVVAKMKKAKLPIILDCVQQLGRTGSYWGEFVDEIFADYPQLILTTAKSASNGQPFSFVVMPQQISDNAYALSQITTNQMNGPLLRAILVSKIFSNKKFQQWIREKSDALVSIAAEYGFKEEHTGLRGKYLNRGIYVGTNENVKLMQIALLVEDGILVGALPDSLRYQPMLLELSETNELVAHTVFRRLKKVQSGEVSKVVRDIYNKMQGSVSGLARKSTS